MKIFKYLFYCVFSILTYAFLFINPSYADSNFLTGYNIIYTAQTDGTTHVDLTGTLTNKITQKYATSISMKFDFSNMTNIQASDKLGNIKYSTKEIDSEVTVILPFNNKVAGVGKKLVFNLSFDTPDIMQKEGNIWEMNIPAMYDQQELSDLTIKVNVPVTFGLPSIVKPYITNNDLYFTKNDLKNSGISISFGNKQTYGYNLTYHLKNTNVFPIKTEIALPPTTNYQTVILDKLNPAPQNVSLDSDGNWIAQYYLLPSQQINVIASGNIIVSDHPTPEVLTAEQRAQDLKSQTYWEADNSQIQTKAKELKTPEAIYNFVVNYLHYDFTRINNNEPRLGAAAVYNNPQSAVCLEFTDLFIALARAANIPAREVDGYAYTQNTKLRPLSYVKDILHAWPEYYNYQKKTWIMVDPTWGNTTHGIDYFHQLDFDHVAFVVKGADSTYPLPAGTYKTQGDKNTKDVSVTFSPPVHLPLEQFSFSPVTNDKYFAGFPMQGQIQVTNSGQIMTSEHKVLISSSTLSPSSQEVDLQPIPPYGTIQDNFYFNSVPFLTNRTYPFTIQLTGRTITAYVVTAPFVLTKDLIIGGFFIVLLTIVIFIITREARRLPVSR